MWKSQKISACGGPETPNPSNYDFTVSNWYQPAAGEKIWGVHLRKPPLVGVGSVTRGGFLKWNSPDRNLAGCWVELAIIMDSKTLGIDRSMHD